MWGNINNKGTQSYVFSELTKKIIYLRDNMAHRQLICIVGYNGAGKTEIVKRISNNLKIKYIDLKNINLSELNGRKLNKLILNELTNETNKEEIIIDHILLDPDDNIVNKLMGLFSIGIKIVIFVYNDDLINFLDDNPNLTIYQLNNPKITDINIFIEKYGLNNIRLSREMIMKNQVIISELIDKVN